ncbi:acetyl/propionyl/methylcrotonyl-CoA carboxylase subunit alpha [Comamonas badia]|uniref:acetyl/propionyl/methylcrotonyl-CoA carboxylase subunit alpha n=1 Tax=Comamonas badia TaxID=265291 RepID=UPI00040E6808|nr:biotin carboxylase N-terminal domain-containing protein [Comamonas badia]
MFEKILIANRGEIACRVLRTCRDMGIWTVAVYSEADASARHVCAADEAVCIGPARAQDSYLNAEAVIAAALKTGAQAIHPGYGFLSERLALIDACANAGITFIGPHREAIASMGSKIESKRIARAAGVPCIPGYDGDDQSPAVLRAEAERIGFPLLIKASGGGGGKGMRRVDGLAHFDQQLATARAEAQAAFGDAKVLLERFITRPRHVEVQLLGDRHGRLLHLFERECSIQRNYQKLIEEAPANHLDAGVKQRLFEAALALGRAIGYDSAGTVEFVLDADHGDAPYFLEVNTRLQVEHPVTELTTGLDLVEWQIRAAAGEPLPWTQGELRQTGWAIEARVNAESPAEGFAPSFGPVLAWVEPPLPGVRIDSGIDAQSEITPHYDSMVAKVIGHGSSRAMARRRLEQGLSQLQVGGLQTTQAMLLDVLRHPAFEATLTTDFLPAHWGGGWQPDAALVQEARAAAALAWVRAQQVAGDDRPMACLRSWRVTAQVEGVGRANVCVTQNGQHAALQVCLGLHGGEVLAPDGEASWQIEAAGVGAWRGVASGRVYRVLQREAQTWVWCAGWSACVQVASAVAHAAAAHAGGAQQGGSVLAELPGVLSQTLVAVGDRVSAGQPVAVLEAMKLFHTLTAPGDGVVTGLPVALGATVARGALLVQMETEGA